MPVIQKRPLPTRDVTTVVAAIGIDPGAKGGLVCLRSNGTHDVQAIKDLTPLEVWEWVRMRSPACIGGTAGTAIPGGVHATGSPTNAVAWPGDHYRVHAAIERVGGYVGEGEGEKGGGAANGSSMFKFGTSFGMLRMALVAAGIPHLEVSPGTWQKACGVSPRVKASKKKGTAGETKTSFKKRMREAAQRLYPCIHITSDTADAVLIAHHLLTSLTRDLSHGLSHPHTSAKDTAPGAGLPSSPRKR
jgi:hypothetical protein